MTRITRRKFSLVLTWACLALLAGCGGSTRGTGGVTVQGQVVNKAQSPLPGVSVTALQTGDAAISDEAGNFELATEAQDSLDLLFESGSINARIVLQNIPSSARVIRATFEIDEGANTVTPRDVETEDHEDDESSDRDDDDSDSESGDDGDDDGSSLQNGGHGGSGSGGSSGSGSGDDDESRDDSSGPGSGADDDDSESHDDRRWKW